MPTQMTLFGPPVCRTEPPYAVAWNKLGRRIVLGKVLDLSDGLVFATPYRHRRFSTPSLPVVVVDFLLRTGVRNWIIRHDRTRKAYSLPLAELLGLATLTHDDELSVPFHSFGPAPYVEWPYVRRVVELDPNGTVAAVEEE